MCDIYGQGPILYWVKVLAPYGIAALLGAYAALVPADRPQRQRYVQRYPLLWWGVHVGLTAVAVGIWLAILEHVRDRYVAQVLILTLLVLMALQVSERLTWIHPPRITTDNLEEQGPAGICSFIQTVIRWRVQPSYYLTPIVVAMGGLMLWVPPVTAWGLLGISSLSGTLLYGYTQSAKQRWQRVYEHVGYGSWIRCGQRCLVWILLMEAFIYASFYLT